MVIGPAVTWLLVNLSHVYCRWPNQWPWITHQDGGRWRSHIWYGPHERLEWWVL